MTRIKRRTSSMLIQDVEYIETLRQFVKSNYIAVVGSGGECCSDVRAAAYQMGKQIAERNCTVVCGGLTGVFDQAFLGAHSRKGQSIAILGDSDVSASIDSSCSHILTTGLGLAKHAIIANACDGAVVIEGWMGALALITEFLNLQKPVVLLETSGGVAGTLTRNPIIEGSRYHLEHFGTPAECVTRLVDLIQSG